jgi:hypothetical protein
MERALGQVAGPTVVPSQMGRCNCDLHCPLLAAVIISAACPLPCAVAEQRILSYYDKTTGPLMDEWCAPSAAALLCPASSGPTLALCT